MFSAFPIGGNYTMDVADAIIAADFVKCNTVIGTHYNTFPQLQSIWKRRKRLFPMPVKHYCCQPLEKQLNYKAHQNSTPNCVI